MPELYKPVEAIGLCHRLRSNKKRKFRSFGKEKNMTQRRQDTKGTISILSLSLWAFVAMEKVFSQNLLISIYAFPESLLGKSGPFGGS